VTESAASETAAGGAAGAAGPRTGAADSAVSFANVTKSFDGKVAVQDLDFRVPRGSVYGLLGPNGAGKTTSIRMLMAILRPETGEIRVLGAEPSAAIKDRIGYLPEERGLYNGMKVLDNLAFFGAIHGLEPRDARRRGAAWLDRLGMLDSAERKLQELSKGNQQKIQFITTALHDPDLFILDEPFTGLDPVNQGLLRDIIHDLVAKGATVCLSTHRMEEVERLCTHLTLIHEGRSVVEGELAEVKRRYGTDVADVEFSGDPGFVKELPGVLGVTRVGNALEIRLAKDRDPSALLADLAGRLAVRRFEVRAPSIHSIFVQLVGGNGGAATPGEGVAPDTASPEATP
jgi:ABC-2 type transport system ATP-binding protein